MKDPGEEAMRELGLSIYVAELREAGHDAHLHPVTGRVAIWMYGRWWDVVGGSSSGPSMKASKIQPSGPK